MTRRLPLHPARVQLPAVVAREGLAGGPDRVRTFVADAADPHAKPLFEGLEADVALIMFTLSAVPPDGQVGGCGRAGAAAAAFHGMMLIVRAGTKSEERRHSGMRTLVACEPGRKGFVCVLRQQTGPPATGPSLIAPPPRPLRAQAAMVRNAWAALRPGGLLCIRDHGLYDMVQLRIPPEQWVGPGHLYRRPDGTLAYFFTPEVSA